jgi:hypothetical protein
MKHIFLLSFITINSYAGIFDNKISDVSKVELYQSIKDEKVQKIEEILKSKPDDSLAGKFNEGFGHQLLAYATYQKKSDKHQDSDHTFACYPKSVRTLIELGAVPSESKTIWPFANMIEGHLSASIISYCPESIKLISSKLSKEDISKASLKFTLLDEFSNDEKMAMRMVETATTLKVILDQLCKDKYEEGCLASVHLKNQLKDFMSRETADRFAETPQGKIQALRDRSCDLQIKIEIEQNAINHEKKIGKAVGIVNSKNLYDSANNVEIFKKELASVNSDLKAKLEKPVPRKDCISHKE